MRRSVVIAGIVAVSLAVLPSAAFADERIGATTPLQPADCPSAGRDPGGGSGTGEPATGGDRGGSGTEPADRAPGGGDEPDDKASGGEEPSDRGSGAGDAPDEKSGGSGGAPDEGSGGSGPGDQSSGTGGEGRLDEAPPGGGSGGDGPDDGASGDAKPGDEEPDGSTSGDQKPGDEKPGDEKPGDEKPGDEKPGTAPARTPAPADPAACPAAGAPAAAGGPAGAATSAAVMRDWGEPNRVDDFDGDLSAWSLYDGPGHAGNGTRSPEAASVKDGILTIDGDAEGTTAGMAWNPGQKYGRWEGRVRAPASDPTYNALLLLWPDAEDFPVGGEVDFMEMMDHTRQETNLFLHYGADNSQVQGSVKIDATQWHNWAVEWTPERITAFVDGKEWWSTDDTSILPPGPMHLCIQLDWFPGSSEGVKPSKMEVDWVRQYALPESEQGGDGKKAEGLLEGIGGTVDDLVRRTEGAPDPVGSSRRAPSGT